MPTKPPKKRLQTAQVNVRMKPEQLTRLTQAVAVLQSRTKSGARYSLSGFMVDTALAMAEKILGK